MSKWLQDEPARVYFLIRAVVMILTALGVGIFEPDAVQEALAALAVVFGVDAFTTQKTRDSVYSPSTVQKIASTATATAGEYRSTARPGDTAGSYIVNVVRDLVPAIKLPSALAAVAPLVAQFANHALTEDLRRDLQRRIHNTLRNAGIMRGRDIPTRTALKSIVFLVSLVILAGCTPVSRTITGGLNELAGDTARLAWAETEAGATTGVTFEPGEAPAIGVIVDVLGSNLVLGTVTGEDGGDCVTEEDQTAIVCTFASVEQPVTIGLTGMNVTAAANYRRTPNGRPYQEFLTD